MLFESGFDSVIIFNSFIVVYLIIQIIFVIKFQFLDEFGQNYFLNLIATFFVLLFYNALSLVLFSNFINLQFTSGFILSILIIVFLIFAYIVIKNEIYPIEVISDNLKYTLPLDSTGIAYFRNIIPISNFYLIIS
ncbi:MAG: hypothetical protein HeimC3_49740 [Candidatus Heimdallarchaeota archaeon LC_3]|nr:MAG: hypothetical protein HeimC3_49740 [Candidatus Heimdallarchaeota archaeon LC_3]